jgi:prepilin-type processing-associated H-X9-DG protein
LLAGPLLSVLLGTLSLALSLLAGVPAIIVGLVCLRALNALNNAPGLAIVWGRRFAVGGMVLGLLGCLLGVFGLLSIALFKLRGKDGREYCADQMRRIGMAVTLYHEVNGHVYPGATVDGPNGLGGFAPWLDEPYPKRLSWFVSVLPYLDRPSAENGEQVLPGPFEKVARHFDPFQPWDAPANRDGINTSIRVFLCPSHPDFDPDHKPAYGYYVGITGLGADAVDLPLSSPRAGFFGYVRRLRTGPNLVNPLPRGAGYTMLATETMVDNGPWAAGDRSTLRGVDPLSRPYIGYDRPFGGMHPGGANVMTVDGAVRFITEQADLGILENLATLSEW